MAGSKKSDEKYSAKEARERFEAALRGARVAGHKPMKPSPAKKAKAKKKPGK
jgi:hypothetical protein